MSARSGFSERLEGLRARVRRRDPLDLIALLAGVVWFAVALFGRPIGDYGVETDFYGDFVPHAREWMRGEPSVMNGFRGPLYYLVLGGLTLPFRDAFLAGKIISALCAALGLRVLGGLLARLFGRSVGLFGALFVAANAVFVECAIRASTDQLYWLLFVTTLALLLGRGEHDARRWLLAGLCAGAAFLTRYNGTVLLAAGPVVAWVTTRPTTTRVRLSGAFGLGWLALAGPWMVFLWSQTGDPLWNQAFQNVATEVYVSHPVFAQNGDFKSAVGFASLLEVIRVDPSAFAQTLGRNLFDHVWRDAKDLVQLPWAAVALAGFVVSAPRWRSRSALAFAAVGVLTYASTLPVFYGPRFMLPLLPWWAAGVGGLAAILRAGEVPWRKARPTATSPPRDRKDRNQRSVSRGGRGSRTPARTAAALLPGALVIVFAGLAALTTVREIRAAHDPLGNKGCASELLDLARKVERAGVHLDATTPIAARKPHIGYVLDAPVVSLQGSSVHALRERGAHYLLVAAPEIMVWPALAELLRDPKAASFDGSLRLIARTGRQTTRGEPAAALFAVLDPRPYEPPPEVSPSRERDTIPGFDRLDSLRLRLVQWYHKWDWGQPTASLIARMSDSSRRHPSVLQVQGDAAMRARDLVAAEDFFREATTLAPDDIPAHLRLAGAAGMRGKPDEFGRLIERIAELHALETVMDPQSWWDLGTEALNHREFTQAIAPLAQCVNVTPPGSPCSKLLGKTFIALEWFPEARNVLEIYRSENPDDPETEQLLRRLAGQARG